MGYMHPFREGQTVRLVRELDEYGGVVLTKGDTLLVTRALPISSVFTSLVNGRPFIGNNSDYEPAEQTPITADVDFPRTEEPAPSDPVFRPNHYARFVIEPITFIQANDLPFDIGNVIKYACRYDAKDGLQDLQKARRYLDIRIETLAREARIEAGEDPNEVWKTVL